MTPMLMSTDNLLLKCLLKHKVSFIEKEYSSKLLNLVIILLKFKKKTTFYLKYSEITFFLQKIYGICQFSLKMKSQRS